LEASVRRISLEAVDGDVVHEAEHAAARGLRKLNVARVEVAEDIERQVL
jgi:hypothetical protein